MELQLHSPYWLLALLLLPGAFVLRRFRSRPLLVVPFAAAWQTGGFTKKFDWPLVALVASYGLGVLALARPQTVIRSTEEKIEGYDIVLAIDVSKSMLFEDEEAGGKPIARMRAVLPVINGFIKARKNDRIGVVLFSGAAYTLSPLTYDTAWVASRLNKVTAGILEDGTAIGDGLALAVARLAGRPGGAGYGAGPEQGKFVILITDGSNNEGLVTPREATVYAQRKQVPVFTIAAGGAASEDKLPWRDAPDGFLRTAKDLDEITLWRISLFTGGEFYRAGDSAAVLKALTLINESKKVTRSLRYHYRSEELFHYPLAGCVLIVAGLGWRRIRAGMRARLG